MRIIWEIDPADISKVREFFETHRENAFVKYRIETNLADDKPSPTKENFWERMVCCLLTTQQRSGPNSAVARFSQYRPFLLNLESCLQQPAIDEHARDVLSNFGGIRFSTKIGRQLKKNLTFLVSGGWEHTKEHLDMVRLNNSPKSERQAAEFLDNSFKGFGPKQSRNLLQALGLSRYEIPLDSRITKWLNDFGFPVKLTANALQDPNYYNFVSEGFRRLAEECELTPCVLDAAIFASYDGDKWTPENVTP